MKKFVTISWLITVLIGIILIIAAGLQRFMAINNTTSIIAFAILFTASFFISLFVTSYHSYMKSEEYVNK